MKSRHVPPHEVLNRQFKLLQKQNKAYSLRALARDLDLSVSFVSGVLAGKRPVPTARLKDFKRVLKMDDVTVALLNRSLEEEVLDKVPTIKKELAKNPFRSSLTEYTEITRKHLPLFGEWFNIAIMDLVTCSNFIDDPNWIGRRLGIKPQQVKEALRLLEGEGFIAKVDGQWTKTTKRIRIPTNRSMDIIRGIHAQLIQLAMQKLLTETSQENFDARLINGVMFAANPANLQRAKDRLNDAIYEVAEILAEGECTEIYQINMQLFPLTKN